MKLKYLLMNGSLAILSALMSSPSFAQQFPDKPIRLVVPFVPGGGSDVLARIMVPRLSELLGQQFIVDNKPGGSSIIGSQIVTQSAPDGYTLLLVDSSLMVNPGLRSNLPYDTIKDFTPIIHLASGPVIMVIHPSVPAKNLAELIKIAKEKPDTLFYGSGGNGASTHLAGEMFNLAAGVKIAHVPFKGTGEAVSATVGGQIPITFTGISSARAHVESGRLRALAVTGKQRNAALPDIPTFTQAGVTGVDSSSQWGVLGPARLPDSVVKRLNEAFNQVLKEPAVLERIAGLGYLAEGGTPQAFTGLIGVEISKWKHVIDSAGISIN